MTRAMALASPLASQPHWPVGATLFRQTLTPPAMRTLRVGLVIQAARRLCWFCRQSARTASSRIWVALHTALRSSTRRRCPTQPSASVRVTLTPPTWEGEGLPHRGRGQLVDDVLGTLQYCVSLQTAAPSLRLSSSTRRPRQWSVRVTLSPPTWEGGGGGPPAPREGTCRTP